MPRGRFSGDTDRYLLLLLAPNVSSDHKRQRKKFPTKSSRYNQSIRDAATQDEPRRRYHSTTMSLTRPAEEDEADLWNEPSEASVVTQLSSNLLDREDAVRHLEAANEQLAAKDELIRSMREEIEHAKSGKGNKASKKASPPRPRVLQGKRQMRHDDDEELHNLLFDNYPLQHSGVSDLMGDMTTRAGDSAPRKRSQISDGLDLEDLEEDDDSFKVRKSTHRRRGHNDGLDEDDLEEEDDEFKARKAPKATNLKKHFNSTEDMWREVDREVADVSTTLIEHQYISQNLHDIYREAEHDRISRSAPVVRRGGAVTSDQDAASRMARGLRGGRR